MIKLIIDTSKSKEARIVLKTDQFEDSLSSENERNSQVVLPLIVKILKKNKLKLQDLTQIEVEKGPGSFTGLRIGISIANTLSQALRIPLNKQNGKLVEAKYK